MSRSGYHDDLDDVLNLGRWRAQVASAVRGKRGQAFLKEMLAALDAMPEGRLIEGDLEKGGEVCAIGAVGKTRGTDMSELDPECPEQVAHAFGIAHQMAAEIVYLNDEAGFRNETPRHRYERMRAWVISQIRGDLVSTPAALPNKTNTRREG